MPTIEERALALVNEVKAERGHTPGHSGFIARDNCSFSEALCRLLEALDAERAAHALFRQKVSDAVELLHNAAPGEERLGAQMRLNSLILPKPVDLLVEVIAEANDAGGETVAQWSGDFLAALAKRGLKLVEVGDAD